MFSTIKNTIEAGYRIAEASLSEKDKGSNVFTALLGGVLVVILYFSLNAPVITAANTANATLNPNASGAGSASTAYNLTPVFLALGGLVLISRVTMGE